MKKIIDIKNEETLLSFAGGRLNEDVYLQILEEDLRNIIKTKKLDLEKMKNLLAYLLQMEYGQDDYHEQIKSLILHTNMPILEAISFMGKIKYQNEYMLSIIFKYFDFEEIYVVVAGGSVDE